MKTHTLQRIVIVGGGFSGTMAVVNLARLSQRALHVTIINAHRPAGRGVAYGTRRAEHVLNVAARNMSAFPDLPEHFLQWLRTRSEFDDVPDRELRERFMPRMIYGDYLRSIVHHHLQGAAATNGTEAEFVDGEAVDMETGAGGVIVHLQDGRKIEADRAVLATGNERPAEIPGSEALTEHPGWVGNPWLSWHERVPRGGTVVMLGTGLTTVDAVITLRAMGWHGVMHAVSRHGWLPQVHFRGIEYPDFPPPNVDLAELGLAKLLGLIEQHCARLREMGANPAIIVDKMRPHTQRIWQKFTREERLEFTKKHAGRWNVIRHRIAPEIHAIVTSAQLTGQFEVHSANIECVEAAGERVRCQLAGGRALEGDLVINATGPQTRFSATRSTLLQNLLRRGLIAPDDMEMGVRVDDDYTAVDSHGNRSPHLLAIGPLLRGTLWETIAVPELRGQAKRVAETLLNQTSIAAEEPAVIEYMI